MNKKIDLDSMSVDDMWILYENIGQALSIRLTSEKRQLERRLAQLRRESETHSVPVDSANPPRERRKYPRVYPKYRNPDDHQETWSGRGKQPRWLTAALEAGHRIEDLAINKPEADGTARHGRA